jgi:porin
MTCVSLTTLVAAVLVCSALARAGERDSLAHDVDYYLRVIAAADSESVGKSGYEDIPEFGGPSSTGTQLRMDDAVKEPAFRLPGFDRFLKPWFDWKGRVNEKLGLAFGLNYTALSQWASESLGEDHAAGGIFEFLGTWTLVGRETKNPGVLVFKIENRHRLGTDIAPLTLGFEAGSILPTTVKFNGFGWGVTNFFWQQRFLGGRAVFTVGVLDPTDYLDVYAAINPLTGFINFQFSTNPTIPVPDQGLGMAVGAMVSEHIYFIAGLTDANGDPTRAGFDTFFEDNEYLTSLEVGWTSSFERRFFDKFDLMVWHQDAREKAGVPEGWGVVGTAEWFFHDKYLPFLRIGWADGGAGLLRTMVSAGLGIHVATRGLVGVGLGWGNPSDGALRDQFTLEVFYRLQLAQNLALTPDIQMVVDPALHPGEDLIFFFALRLRLTF